MTILGAIFHTALTSCVVLLLAAEGIVVLYYWVFLLARLAGVRSHVNVGGGPRHRFAVLIPAHNEADVLEVAVRSCAAMDYPKDRFEVFVIADNCTDRTAAVARQFGAICFERHDTEHVGKGYALQWAFEQVLPRGHDALVVLDADCWMDDQSLLVFDKCLAQSDRVVQGNHVVADAESGPTSYAASVGEVLACEALQSPKSKLGLGGLLLGTGFLLQREVLTAVPWHAYSQTEDVEYSLALARANCRVRFVENARTFHRVCNDSERFHVQRARWAEGTLRLGRAGLEAIWEGIVRRRLLLVDTGMSILVQSRPMVLAVLLAAAAGSGVLALTRRHGVDAVLLSVAIGLLGLQITYFAVGVLRIGLTARRVMLLFAAPLVIAKLTGIGLGALIRPRRGTWQKTPR